MFNQQFKTCIAMKWIIIIFLFTSCATVSTIDNMKFAGNDLVIVNIQMNGVNERFLVDTGSSSSYISTEFLKTKRKFNLSERTASYASAASYIEYNTTKVKMTLFGYTYWFNTISLYALNRSLSNGVIGILGCDFLRKNKLIIDYNKREIYQAKD